MCVCVWKRYGMEECRPRYFLTCLPPSSHFLRDRLVSPGVYYRISDSILLFSSHFQRRSNRGVAGVVELISCLPLSAVSLPDSHQTTGLNSLNLD